MRYWVLTPLCPANEYRFRLVSPDGLGTLAPIAYGTPFYVVGNQGFLAYNKGGTSVLQKYSTLTKEAQPQTWYFWSAAHPSGQPVTYQDQVNMAVCLFVCVCERGPQPLSR